MPLGSRPGVAQWLGAVLVVVMIGLGRPLAAESMQDLPPLPSGIHWPPLAENDRQVLEELYRSTDGDHWTTRFGWLTDASPCEWFGVRCGPSSNGRSVVEGLMLESNNLRGVLPESVASLKSLKILSLGDNLLSGTVPEELLARWDANLLEFGGSGNRFANLVTRIHLSSLQKCVLCSEDSDVLYSLELADDGSAIFRSVRCVPGTERETHCLVRVGHFYDFARFSRALTRIGFAQLEKSYDSPSWMGTTHGVWLTTSAWWGDGCFRETESYRREGPLDLWIAQQLFLSLVEQCYWEQEYFEPGCEHP